MKASYLKSVLVLLTGTFYLVPTFAQSPEKMSYQAVIRSSNNALVTNTSVGMQISILQGSENGMAVYIETQTPTTNANGLISIEIGNGTVVNGNFAAINWANGPYFIKTEVDPGGGTSYTITGISQMLSVPYALHAKTADNIVGGLNETDPHYASDSSLIKTSVRNWNSSLSKNISSADTTRWGNDTDAFNEFQALSISNDSISLSKGGTIKLPSETDPYYASDSSLIKTSVRSWNGSLSKNISTADTARWGNDTDAFNELQALSISNDSISLSMGGTIKLPSETDPHYASDSSLIKTSVRSWNGSLAKNISPADTANWNNKTYLSDSDDDTKIETEQAADEDVIRMKVAGNERMSINDTSGVALQLPTSDNNSSLKVKNSNGNVVFGVDGRGLMNGDGSGLSNVRPLIAYAGGNSDVVITSYDPYNPTLVKNVVITVPGPGIILTQATGYIQWKSKNDDYCRMSIISNDVATNTASFGSNYFSYLMLSGDHNLADSIDEYNNFSYSRVFTVTTAGTYGYNLWADKAYARCYIQIADVNMQVIYFPTGGTGPLLLKSAAENESSDYDPSIPRNLDGTIATGTRDVKD